MGDTKCYVIEATHTNGTEYIYWIDPDHDALGSFLPDDITNGSTVVLVTGETSLRFSWQNGAVVDKDGREVEVDRPIKAESEKVKKPEPKRK